MQVPQVLFFTCAIGFHENFVIPYTYFASKYNPDAKFEYVVSDIDRFREKHYKSLLWLKENMGAEVQLRSIKEVDATPKMANSYRFIMEPSTTADYTYIGDVDIMILENVYNKHKVVFECGMPYSNVIRKDSKRLTGLHFVKNSEYYPLPKYDDLVSTISNDEELLYAVTKRKGILFDNSEVSRLGVGRPIHGLHMSLNRLPFSFKQERVSWGVEFAQFKQMKELLESPDFNSFLETLYPGSSGIITNLKVLSEGVVSLGQSFWKDTRYIKH